MVRVVLTVRTGPRAPQAQILDLEPRAEVIMGETGAAAVQLAPEADPPVGAWKARIIRVEGKTRRFVLVDLGSPGGVFVNHRRIKDAVLLRAGDIIQLGQHGPEIEFRAEELLL